MKRFICCLLVCVMAALGIAGCSGSDNDQINVVGQGEYSYDIYTVSQTGGLASYEFMTDLTDKDALADELIARMQTVPAVLYQNSAFGEGIKVNSITFTGSVAIVDVNAAYEEQDSVDEVLLRSALVETLTQIDGVRYVRLFVDGEAFLDDDGEDLGYMQASDFLSGASDEGEALTGTVTLWFLDEEGSELVPVQETVTFASHSTIEAAAVKALIDGPVSSDYNATLPDTVNLISVQVREGICYVNMGAQFVNDALDLEAYLPIDSIVETLMEFDGVDGVQIMVNGSSDVMFKNTIPLDQVFTEAMNGYPEMEESDD